MLAQIDDLTRDLDEDRAGQVLYQLADQQYRSGRWPLAAEIFQALSERYPRHWLTPSAAVWLVQYYASGAAACRVKQPDAEKRWERTAELGKEIERTRPDLFALPAVGFPLAAAYRGLGQARLAQRCYQLQSHGGQGDAWSACAQSELRLGDPGGRPARPTLECIKTEVKPRLDGQLDDPVWQRAKPATLQSTNMMTATGPPWSCSPTMPTFCTLRRAVAPAAAGRSTAGPTPARPRDADLSAHDRLEVLLDVDRDYTTSYRLAVNDRGWTNDSCWGDATWNPEWFVAVKWDDDIWTLEAAIPLAELTARPPKPRDVWAIGVQRVVPDTGFQSWSTPAAISVLPEGFGYLVFE